jgi:hypothetical protein
MSETKKQSDSFSVSGKVLVKYNFLASSAWFFPANPPDYNYYELTAQDGAGRLNFSIRVEDKDFQSDSKYKVGDGFVKRFTIDGCSAESGSLSIIDYIPERELFRCQLTGVKLLDEVKTSIEFEANFTGFSEDSQRVGD